MDEEKIYYRNTNLIGDIDEFSLWELIGGLFVLVDEDQHITLPYQEYSHLFILVEN